MSVPKNKAFAFWKYDRFPYMLGGKVDVISKEKESGRTVIQSSDYSNMSFYPEFFLDEKTGAGVRKELEELKAEKAEEQKRLDNKYINLINALFDEVGVPNRIEKR